MTSRPVDQEGHSFLVVLFRHFRIFLFPCFIKIFAISTFRHFRLFRILE